jgi:hypothetical protein
MHPKSIIYDVHHGILFKQGDNPLIEIHDISRCEKYCLDLRQVVLIQPGQRRVIWVLVGEESAVFKCSATMSANALTKIGSAFSDSTLLTPVSPACRSKAVGVRQANGTPTRCEKEGICVPL